MSKQPVSVTLERDNVTWLRAQVRARKRRSLSDMLDLLVSEARIREGARASVPRSVVGTVTFDPDDPELAGADAAIRALFATRRRGAGRHAGKARRG